MRPVVGRAGAGTGRAFARKGGPVNGGAQTEASLETWPTTVRRQAGVSNQASPYSRTGHRPRPPSIALHLVEMEQGPEICDDSPRDPTSLHCLREIVGVRNRRLTLRSSSIFPSACHTSPPDSHVR